MRSAAHQPSLAVLVTRFLVSGIFWFLWFLASFLDFWSFFLLLSLVEKWVSGIVLPFFLQKTRRAGKTFHLPRSTLFRGLAAPFIMLGRKPF